MTNFATQTIKGQQYKLLKLDPLAGGRLATQVGQILAGAVGDVETIKSLIQSHIDRSKEDSAVVADGEAKGTLEKLLEAPQLIAAMAGGISKINAEALYEMGLTCIRGKLFATHKLHDDTAMNEWFADRPDHLLLVLAWALKANCSGFFGFGGQG